jgi:hypothetical protein
VSTISIDAARELLDFGGGTAFREARLTPEAAEDQLQGAVAIHNILAQRSVAYLADEVGLGKTYVALGALALFRHFDPGFRLLVIAPKENIQRKWIGELQTFVRNNVRFPDLRMKSVQGTPVRPAIYCSNLQQLVRETALDPDRDFFTRLTSFSFGVAREESDGWRQRRDELLDLLPWFPPDLLSLHSKDQFKRNYARAVCCALPPFDLVIVDEAHNLKGGLHRSAAMRNQLVALTFGNDADAGKGDLRRLKDYGPRAKRLLLISATPIEDDYRHLWNQLDVFGLGSLAAELAEPAIDAEEKRAVVSRFLIRRVTSIPAGSSRLTKNQYRRQWRAGGVAEHDRPLPDPGDRQRLIVALMQKKVSELLASPQCNHSFQIGMLASFESFLQTTKVLRSGEEAPVFDDGEQTENALEREGIDVEAVNALGADYRRRFGHSMPHPKMDALVANLRTAFDTGRKTLVFVRRVASVTEIKQKLDEEYDCWLFARMRAELLPELQPRLEQLIGQYCEEKASRRKRVETAVAAVAVDVDPSPDEERSAPEDEDQGGIETFFAWFFRGEGPPGVLSGAAIAKRFVQARFALSSFFADNYAAGLLGVQPGNVFAALQERTNRTPDDLRAELQRRAGALIVRKEGRTTPHLTNFLSFQQAAVELLAEAGDARAHDVLRESLHERPIGGEPVSMEDWLERPTFFTALRAHPALRGVLWPEEPSERFGAQFRREEMRRELLASTFRLGHAFIDFYIAIANRLGTFDSTGAEVSNEELGAAVVELLERQQAAAPYRTFHELRDVSANFDLIVDANLGAEFWQTASGDWRTQIGKLLRAQQPVGGMWGSVNRTLVKQFRMPGYPFVLAATDLLQEGEDLHLFCSDVVHYGISWMPSSMEQRIGRIDRVRSQTQRRLSRLGRSPEGDELLQVYFPYLRETVEVYQVNRVLERMGRFLRLMHEGLGATGERDTRRIDILHESQQMAEQVEAFDQPLRSSFPVSAELLVGERTSLAVTPALHRDLLDRFSVLQDELEQHGVTWDRRVEDHAPVGCVVIGARRQAFTIFLHSLGGLANVRCVSPVGVLDANASTDVLGREARPLVARVCAVYDKRFTRYSVTAEHDVLLGDRAHDAARVWWLIRTTAATADRLEQVLLRIDAEVAAFGDELRQEPSVER